MTCVSFAWKFKSFLPDLDPETGHWRFCSLGGLLHRCSCGVTPRGASPWAWAHLLLWSGWVDGPPSSEGIHAFGSIIASSSQNQGDIICVISPNNMKLGEKDHLCHPCHQWLLTWAPDSSTVGSLGVVPVKRKEVDCWEGEGGLLLKFKALQASGI